MSKAEYTALCIVLFAAVSMYLPGLSGPFLFDDYNTLKPLGNWVAVDALEKLRLFLSSGFTGPTGRPVSLFTFYLNSNTWPAAPFPFILTNIFIHILNGVFVFFLIKKITSVCEAKQEFLGLSVGVIVAALWVLHPMHTSTVLYIVQRMTLLSATFSLLAILTYLEARNALLNIQNSKALALLAGVFLMALVALFSKENAALLPLQILILEMYLWTSNRQSSRPHKILVFAAIVPAAILVLAYPLKAFLLHIIDYWLTGQEQTYGRSYTMLERFWTQQRVLGEYIFSLVLPKMQTSGVFHDNYPISRSLFEPITTLFWLIFHISALVVAFALRKRLPWLFFGVFWFYGSHVLESTFLMLEIKFEHRNYLPSLGLFFIVANILPTIKSPVLRGGTLVATTLAYCVFLFMSTNLWGRPVLASMVWVAENPGSSRANEHAAYMAQIYEDRIGRAKELARRSVELSREPRPEISFIAAFCETYDGGKVDWSDLAQRIERGSTDWSLHQVLKALLDQSIEKKCELLDFEGYRSLLNAYQRHGSYKGHMSALLIEELQIHAALHFGERELALELERHRDELTLPLAFKMNRAIIFASFGELEFAASRLEIGIKVADRLQNENEFTLKNAREMLELIKKDIPVNAGAKYEE